MPDPFPGLVPECGIVECFDQPVVELVHTITDDWESRIHRGDGGGDHSEAYSRIYFSTPSTSERILLWEASDGRFNSYNLTANARLNEERRTIHLPAMVEATMVMEYGNLRASVTEVKFAVVVV